MSSDGEVIRLVDLLVSLVMPGAAPPWRQSAVEALVRGEEPVGDLTLQSVLKVAPIGVGFVRDRVLGWVNGQVEELIGYQRHELIGQRSTILYESDEEFERVGLVKYRDISAKGTGTVRTRFRKKDGSTVEVLLSSAPLVPGDLSQGTIFTVADVSELVTVKEALEQRQTILDGIAEAAKDSIFCKGVDGRYTFCNKAMERLLGRPASQILGKTVEEVFEGEAAKIVRAADDASLAGEVVDATRTLAIAGERHALHVIQVPMRDVDGVITGVSGVVRDVTEAMAMEEERQQLREQLAQSEKMRVIGQLAGGIAHDFNNQLMGIMGYADLLRNALGGSPRLLMYAETIVNAAERASKLTGQLLSFARRGPMVNTAVPLDRIVQEVHDLLEHTLDRLIDVRYYLPGPSPVVEGDPNQLQSALLNLALNAKDAMPTGGAVTLGVELVELEEAYCKASPFALVPGRYGVLTCRDTGHGMAPEVLARAFEPFFTTKPQGEGIGMGLTAVYGTMKQHRGAVEIASQPGVGTEARLLVPLAEARGEDHDLHEKHLSPQRKATGGHKGRSLLVADDDPVVRRFLKDALTSRGCSVTTCQDGEEAVLIVKKQPDAFDLVLLDMIMPTMDGLTAYRAIKGIAPTLPVLILSGYSLKGAAKTAMEEGARAFVQKPVKIDDLIAAITGVLGDVSHR